MQVEFEFTIDDQIVTPFGDEGYITMCALDDNGAKTYWVKTAKKDTTGWYLERKIHLR